MFPPMPAVPSVSPAGREVDALSTSKIWGGILDGKGPLVACVRAARRPAEQRLPEPRDGIRAFEVNPDGVGLGIRKRGPRLADNEVVGLEERVPKPRRPAGAGEVGFDEQAHRPSLTRHPKLGAQATRDGRVDGAGLVARSRDTYGNRGGHEPILRPEGAQRVNRDQSRLTPEFEGRLGAWNADRPGELTRRDDRGR